MLHTETNSSEGSARDCVAGEDGYFDYLDREDSSPSIVPVYNGKELDISPALISHALSGISFKHYDGSCSKPKISPVSEESLLGEDYVFDYGESIFNGEDEFFGELSETSSSGMRLCYVPRKHDEDTRSENVAEGESETESKPSCVLDNIRDRNSFWNLHRPELCKLTWPQEYVGEATITDHLHRHLLHHGKICAQFHERRNLLALLNKELDSYNKLKELLPPRELPPDEKRFNISGNRKKFGARSCNRCAYVASASVNLNGEIDHDLHQPLHISKEEFCITIGKPARRPKLRGLPILEPEQIWLAGEGSIDDYGEYQGYTYPGFWEDARESRYSACEGDEEDSNREEMSEPEVVVQQQTGWVEPDFCAMI